MRYWLIAAIAVAAYSVSILVAADTKSGDKEKDKAASDESKLVAGTREKLNSKVTVDWKDTRLEDCLKELEGMTEAKFYYAVGVSKNQSVTYGAKDKLVKDVLHEVFKERGLGYIIHRKARDGDRYEGWVQVVQGDERGDPAGEKKDTPPAKTASKTPAKPPAKTDSPPTKPDAGGVDEEKAAASKLKQAKSFLEDGQTEDAKDFCEQILKRFPKTKAAAEAKELLEKIKKK
jgi:hypothetical protein